MLRERCLNFLLCSPAILDIVLAPKMRAYDNISSILNGILYVGVHIGVECFIGCLMVYIQLPSFPSLHFPVDFVHVFLE